MSVKKQNYSVRARTRERLSFEVLIICSTAFVFWGGLSLMLVCAKESLGLFVLAEW